MISIKDAGSNLVPLKSTAVAGEHVMHHNVDQCALPPGASTESTVASILAAILAQASKIETQPVSISSGTLTGMATETTQAAVLARANLLATEVTQALVYGAVSAMASAYLRRTDTLSVTPGQQSGYKVQIGPIAVSSAVELVALRAGAQTTLLQLIVSNPSSTATWVIFKDGATELFRVYAAGATCQVIEPSKYVAMTGTVATAVNVQCSEVSTNVYVFAAYK